MKMGSISKVFYSFTNLEECTLDKRKKYGIQTVNFDRIYFVETDAGGCRHGTTQNVFL